MPEDKEERSTVDKVMVTVLMGISILIGYQINNALSNKIPTEKKVQESYIAPSDIEIKCEDRDKTDKRELPETYINIAGREYVLRYDEQGKPVIQEYTVKPAEIIPKSLEAKTGK